MAELHFESLEKWYGEVPALRGIDLDIADGEIITIVGPSGCGKSTLLLVAAGLEPATAGAVRIGLRDVTRLPPAARNVSMVFQSYALFPHLTVAENIGFGLAVRRTPKDQARTQVEWAAALVGCDALLKRRPFELSGGERQRVALARALVRRPDVFLLDEPLSNLDAQLRVQMRAELQELHRAVGTTMVYVTHDQVEALTVGHRVAVLSAGVVQQVGAPDDVYRRPSNRFVATFVGSPSMNVLEARADTGIIRAGAFEVPVRNGARLGANIQLGIRPEHLRIAIDGHGVPATVEVVEIAGDVTFLHLQAGDDRLILRAGPDSRPPVGARVRVEAPPERCYVFDADSGDTLVQAG